MASGPDSWGARLFRSLFVLFTIVIFFSVTIALVRGIHGHSETAGIEPIDIAAAKSTALTESPTSNVPGKSFDRFVTIWLENQDYGIAAGDPNLEWLGTQGITLSNYYAITHPSQPNYVAAIGGSTHRVISDDFYHIDKSVKTLIDLLEAKGVSWSEYQEDMPYSGFQGNYVNQKTGANDYVRKHNPVMSYDSVTSDIHRLAKVKNFTLFYEDLANDALAQWMFITPNMTNCGHDTSVTVAGAWARSFLTPLLTDPKFMKNTLVLLTFDESESYFRPNRVFSVLLGDVIPESSHGTTDSTLYNIYSQMSTVENNWDLGHLGLADRLALKFF